MARRSQEALDMGGLVLNVLVGIRSRWSKMTIKEKQDTVNHMRIIANTIELSIGQDECK